MFHMSERVTVRTKNSQINLTIIIPIMIYMMNSQYFWFFVITTLTAFFYHSSSNHISSNGSKITFPYRLVMFINTFPRTIFSFCRLRINKLFVAMSARIFGFSSIFIRFITTFVRTIFSFITATRYMRKFFPANMTINGYFRSGSQSLAFSRTIFSNIKLIFFNVKRFFTNFAIYKFSSSYYFRRSFHAIN